jgi:hypothetical protein
LLLGPNKLDELKSRLQDSNRSIDIIGITEVYPKNCRYNPGKAELQIDGYDLFIEIRLIRSLKKFIFRYQDLVEKYSVSAETIINDGFS